MKDVLPQRTSGRRRCGNLRPMLGFGHGGFRKSSLLQRNPVVVAIAIPESF
jgi:hypothetical protein